jgi:hypothetical protein
VDNPQTIDAEFQKNLLLRSSWPRVTTKQALLDEYVTGDANEIYSLSELPDECPIEFYGNKYLTNKL